MSLPEPELRESPGAPADRSATGRSWGQRLAEGLAKTRARLGAIFSGGRVDDEWFEELESALLTADAGVDAAAHLVESLRSRARRERVESREQLRDALALDLANLLAPLEKPFAIGDARPYVIMVTGVNGAGKTTSIGKLAHYFHDRQLSVLLAAGDTFRAAAREQLAAWGARNDVTVISQEGADPGAVIYDAIQSARARRIDVVLADTAGRLPTQLHLMEELKKIKRVIAKAQEGAPHEVWTVLDANTGQNALAQVKAFDEALGLTGLVLTKLDGTARGGVIAAIARARPVPLRFIGVGEGIEDLRPFVAAEFARALLA